MAPSSRRSFLALAGAGTAAAGLSTAIAGVSGSFTIAGQPAAEPPVPSDLTGSLVAYVADFHGDEVTLMLGDDEVVVHDAQLVAKLARAVGSGTSAL